MAQPFSGALKHRAGQAEGANGGQQWNKVQIIHTHAIHACVKKAVQAACTPPPPRRGGEEKPARYARPRAGGVWYGRWPLRPFVLCAVLWRSLPQQLPMQFSLDGEVNRLGGKAEFLAMCAAGRR